MIPHFLGVILENIKREEELLSMYINFFNELDVLSARVYYERWNSFQLSTLETRTTERV